MDFVSCIKNNLQIDNFKKPVLFSLTAARAGGMEDLPRDARVSMSAASDLKENEIKHFSVQTFTQLELEGGLDLQAIK